MTVDPIQPYSEDSSPVGSPRSGSAPTNAPVKMSKQDRRAQREHNDLITVLNTEEGRAVLMRILNRCNPYKPNTEPDAFRQGIREGQRQIGTWLIATVTRADPVGYSKLLEDNAQRLQKIANDESLIAENEQKKADKATPLHRIRDWGLRMVRRAI